MKSKAKKQYVERASGENFLAFKKVKKDVLLLTKFFEGSYEKWNNDK